jgi:predicted nucleotidyltransferase
MAMIQLPPDFKEFLKLLNDKRVEYLVIGGYAVGYHGYIRATGDIDVWVAPNAENAAKTIAALREFGFDMPDSAEQLLLMPDNILRMGVPPVRIEVLSSISGVSFDECYAERLMAVIDNVEAPIISLRHLKINKRAAGRPKDLIDLEHLA